MSRGNNSIQVNLPSLNFEVVASASIANDDYPEACWMNIGCDRLKRASDRNAMVVMVCLIKRNTYVYYESATKLLDVFTKENVTVNPKGTCRYKYYIKYKTGEIFAESQGLGYKNIIKLKH